VTRQVVRVRGLETDVLEFGSGSPLLFLHSGFGPDIHSTEYLERLGQQFHVYAPFHPGFGRFARPKSFRNVGDLAYFYLDLIEQWRLQDIVLVGAGFGGWIASEMAVRTTERLARLILVSPFGIKVGTRDDRDFTDFYSISPDERAALEFNAPDFATLSYAGKSDEDLSIQARGRESEAYYGWEPFMHNPQLRQWLHRVRVPTILVRGSDDRVVARRNYDAYAAELPDCAMVTIDGAGHHPHLDAPSAFVSAVQSAIKIRKPSVIAI